MNSAEELCHSSGPWKKHKYFQKIGEGANAVYKYAKSVPGRMTGEYYDKEKEKYNEEYWKHVEDSVAADEKQGPAIREMYNYLGKADMATDPRKRRFYRQVSRDYARDYARDYDRAYNAEKRAEAKANEARDKRDKAFSKSYNAPLKKISRSVERGQKLIDSLFHPKETVSVTSNLMPAGTKKTIKK